jgi:DNA polymerase III sliding clamp (beta) subunit (PCNA family)
VSNPDDIVMEGVVAVKCLTFLQRFTSECKGVLKVGMGESRVSFKGERGEVISQLIDGRYPKYDDLIPKGNDKKAEVNRDALLSGVRMASFMTTEGYRVVKFLFRGGGLTLASKTADVGEAELEVPVNYEGPDFEIYFNPDYIADTLRSSECETVVMEFKDGGSPVVLRSGYEHVDVIMPIGIR